MHLRALFCPFTQFRAKSADPQPFPVSFGIEDEIQGLSQKEFAQITKTVVGGYVRQIDKGNVYAVGPALRLPRGRASTWKMDTDAGGVELITPPLRGTKGLSQTQAIVAAAGARGATCSKGSGMHVHTGARHLRAVHLQRLMAITTQHEHWFYLALGVHEERRHYCKPTPKGVLAALLDQLDPSVQKLLAAWELDRYHGVNLSNLLPGGIGTVEFRYFNSTTDPALLGANVGFVMHLLRHAVASRCEPDLFSHTPGIVAFLRQLGLPLDHPFSLALRDRLVTHLAEGLAHVSQSSADKEDDEGQTLPCSALAAQLRGDWRLMEHLTQSLHFDTSPLEAAALTLFLTLSPESSRVADLQQLRALSAFPTDAQIAFLRDYHGRQGSLRALLALRDFHPHLAAGEIEWLIEAFEQPHCIALLGQLREAGIRLGADAAALLVKVTDHPAVGALARSLAAYPAFDPQRNQIITYLLGARAEPDIVASAFFEMCAFSKGVRVQPRMGEMCLSMLAILCRLDAEEIHNLLHSPPQRVEGAVLPGTRDIVVQGSMVGLIVL